MFLFKQEREDTKPVSHVDKQSVVAMPMGPQCINRKSVCSEEREREKERGRIEAQ